MIKFLILLFPLLSSSFVFAAPACELMFSSAVEVSPRAEISAYDLVEAKNLNEDLLAQLKQIKVADAKTTRIEKMTLAKLLRSVRAHFILPSELKILRSQSSVSRMEVARKIKNQILMNCVDCDVQVQVASVPTQLATDWNLDLNVDLTKNSAMIPISSSQAQDKKGWVVADIKRYQNLPVLNRSIKVGEVIVEDMLTLEKRLVTQVRDTVQNVTAVIGMQTVRFLNAGQTIMYSDLKKEQIMKKGQMVKAIIGNSTFEVSISAQVEENGSIGDVIKIKNLDSQKVFAAKVIERGLVRIE
ncbi:MAG: flagellar basal body P-ring formation protein FlgA [Bdellovibrionaceae bacterium]|nr:flagellar basal body P-ring formation protein FlgA [Bdellovibrio sp.]